MHKSENILTYADIDELNKLNYSNKCTQQYYYMHIMISDNLILNITRKRYKKNLLTLQNNINKIYV